MTSTTLQMNAGLLDSSSASPLRLELGLERLAYGALYVFVFAIPWEQAPQFGGFPIGRWLGLVAFGLALLRVAISGRIRSLSVLHYWMAALVGWIALSLLWTVDWESTAARIGTFSQLLLAVWLIWELARTQTRILGLLRAYVWGIFLSSLITLGNFTLGITSTQLYGDEEMEKWVEIPRYSIPGVNSNDLGLMLALSLPMMLYLLVQQRKKPLDSWIHWIQIAACVTAIFLTGSRGSLLAGAVGALMFPLALRQLPPSQKLASLAGCVGVIACGASLVPAETWRRLLQTGSEISEGTMTNRTVIWAAGLDAFRDHAFLGVGSGAYAATVLRAVDIPYVAHNTFLSVLVELGVVGAILLFAILAGLFYIANRMRYLERCLWLTLLLTWGVGVSSLTWEYRKPTWLLFGLLAAHAYSQRPKFPRAWPRFQNARAEFSHPRAWVPRVPEWR